MYAMVTYRKHTNILKYFSIPCIVTLAACTQTENIETSLQSAQSILDRSNDHNPVKYQLTFEREFPCQINLQENWSEQESDWHQVYRFDLTDIEAGTFVQSKAGRRAIIYSGSRTSAEQGKKEFREIRINNLRYRGNLSLEDQQRLIEVWNKAIAICEDKYLLE